MGGLEQVWTTRIYAAGSLASELAMLLCIFIQ